MCWFHDGVSRDVPFTSPQFRDKGASSTDAYAALGTHPDECVSGAFSPTTCGRRPRLQPADTDDGASNSATSAKGTSGEDRARAIANVCGKRAEEKKEKKKRQSAITFHIIRDARGKGREAIPLPRPRAPHTSNSASCRPRPVDAPVLPSPPRHPSLRPRHPPSSSALSPAPPPPAHAGPRLPPSRPPAPTRPAGVCHASPHAAAPKPSRDQARARAPPSAARHPSGVRTNAIARSERRSERSVCLGALVARRPRAKEGGRKRKNNKKKAPETRGLRSGGAPARTRRMADAPRYVKSVFPNERAAMASNVRRGQPAAPNSGAPPRRERGGRARGAASRAAGQRSVRLQSGRGEARAGPTTPRKRAGDADQIASVVSSRPAILRQSRAPDGAAGGERRGWRRGPKASVKLEGEGWGADGRGEDRARENRRRETRDTIRTVGADGALRATSGPLKQSCRCELSDLARTPEQPDRTAQRRSVGCIERPNARRMPRGTCRGMRRCAMRASRRRTLRWTRRSRVQRRRPERSVDHDHDHQKTPLASKARTREAVIAFRSLLQTRPRQAPRKPA